MEKVSSSLPWHLKIPASASERNRVSVGFNTIDWIGYADDIVLFFEDTKNMQDTLDLLTTTFDRFSLKLNSSKTKTMIFSYDEIGTEYPNSIVSVAGSEIENVEASKYLAK